MLHIPSCRQYWPRDFTEPEITVFLSALVVGLAQQTIP
jgi:hypothetical protein